MPDILYVVLIAIAVVIILDMVWSKNRTRAVNRGLIDELEKLHNELNAATTERIKLRRGLLRYVNDLESANAFNRDLCEEMAILRRIERDHNNLEIEFCELQISHEQLKNDHTFLWERATDLFMKQEPTIKVSTDEEFSLSVIQVDKDINSSYTYNALFGKPTNCLVTTRSLEVVLVDLKNPHHTGRP